MVVPLHPAQADDELLGRIWALRRACSPPGDPIPPRAYSIAVMRHGTGTASWWHWIEGDADGYAALVVRLGSMTGILTDLVVAPGRRRLGIGRALLDAAAAQSRDVGCTHLVGSYRDGPGAGFARAAGARDGTDRIRRSALPLPLTTPPALPVTGYRMVSWTGAAPEELLASYAEARNAINDAPHDVAVDDDRYTPERIRAMEAAVARRGAEMRVTVAVDGAGTVAGFTEVRVPPEPGAPAFTEDTAVVAAHRRRGLAMWIKDASLRSLARDRPDVPVVVTDNDLTNTAMLAVNDRLGFVVTSVRTGAVLDL
jgi:mycothiol synthase